MSISSQLPPIALAQASPGLRALAQASGQTVEARVISPASNGTTQVQIGRQVMNLALPEGHPVGTTLTLSVQQSDGQLRLALIAVRPPDMAPVPLAGLPPTPATTVQLSAAALSSQSTSPQAPVPQPVPPGQVAPATPAPAANPATAGQRAGLSPISTVPTYVSAAPGAPAPTQPTAQPAPAAPVTAGSNAVPTNPVAHAGPGNPPAPAIAATAAVPATSPSATPPTMAQGGGPTPATPAGVSQPMAAPVVTGVVGTGVPPMRAEIPYAVAAPAVAPVSSPASGARPAAIALPPVGQAIASGSVGQNATSPSMGGSSPGVQAAPATPAAQPSTPQAALAQMVQQSLPRQDSILGLTRALTAIAGKVGLPEPVAKAAQQLLAARVPLDGIKLSGAAIKAAVQQSGVFQEALLAGGQVPTGDVKTALLGLRQSLGAWLGNQAPVTQVGGVAPPLRGQVPRARAGEASLADMPDDPVETGKILLERTEAALSRLRLHQNASLPDGQASRQDSQWSMDLPVIVAGQQQVLQLQIHRDAEQEADRSTDRGWQVRFAINLAERGEVGAQISLRAKNLGVLLWADREDTAMSLAQAVEGLREAILEVGLVPGAIVVRAGAPAEQSVPPATQDRHYLDAIR